MNQINPLKAIRYFDDLYNEVLDWAYIDARYIFWHFDIEDNLETLGTEIWRRLT